MSPKISQNLVYKIISELLNYNYHHNRSRVITFEFKSRSCELSATGRVKKIDTFKPNTISMFQGNLLKLCAAYVRYRYLEWFRSLVDYKVMCESARHIMIFHKSYKS